MNTRQVINLIEDDGWRYDYTSGGHMQFKHPVKPGKVTVPFHGANKDMNPRTVKSIKRQAGLQ